MKIKEIITVQRATGETNCIHYEQPNGTILIDVCITSDIEDDEMPEISNSKKQLDEFFGYLNEIFSEQKS